MRTLGSIGVSHCHASLGALEQISFRPAELAEVLGRLARLPGVSGAALLSTCNRTEVYAAHDNMADLAALADSVMADRGLSPANFAGSLCIRDELQTVDHLFRVAAGLDSMVLGESEIQGQVRAAAAVARSAGTLDPMLDALFRWAVLTGRRVRRESTLSATRRSLGSTAVDLGADVLGGKLTGRRVLVLGTGRIAAAVTDRVLERGGQLLVGSRTRDRAEQFAAGRGDVLELAELAGGLVTADLLIVCSSAPHHLVEAARLRRLVPRRNGRLLVIVDLAMPRNVDPASRQVPGVRVLDLDDMGSAGAADATTMAAAMREAERVVTEEAERFRGWTAGRRADAVIRAVRARVERLAQAEGMRAVRTSGETRPEAVEEALRRLTAKLLHRPTVLAREAAAVGDVRLLAEICRMFGVRAESVARTDSQFAPDDPSLLSLTACAATAG